MSYPIGKPPYVNIHKSKYVPGSAPISIPSATSFTSSFPASWSGRNLITVLMGYHAASDYVIIACSVQGGSPSLWDAQLVAFGPMVSDTPTFGTPHSLGYSAATTPNFTFLSPDALYAAVTYNSGGAQNRYIRIHCDSSGNITTDAIDAGDDSISIKNIITDSTLGTWASFQDNPGGTQEHQQINTSTVGSQLSGAFANGPTYPLSTGGCVVNGNGKFIVNDPTNGLCYLTSLTSTLTYSSGISAYGNKLCYNDNYKEVLGFSNQSGTQNWKTFDVTGGTPSNTFTQSIPVTSGYVIRNITYNHFLDRYVFAASDSSATGNAEIGVVNRKPGGLVAEGTKAVTTDTGGGSYFMNVSAGKWIITYNINDDNPTNTFAFYKIG